MQQYSLMETVAARIDFNKGLFFSYVRARYLNGETCGMKSVYTWLCQAMTRELSVCKFEFALSPDAVAICTGSKVNSDRYGGLKVLHALFNKLERIINKAFHKHVEDN